LIVEFVPYISVVEDNRFIGYDDVQCGKYIISV